MSSAVHLSPLAADGRLATLLQRRSGRAFRIDAGPMRGDTVVTLPDAPGPLTVLVPRGLGRALLARGAGPWRAEGSGEKCLPTRWVNAGGVSAWIREVERPTGPRQALPPAARPQGTPDAWVVVMPCAAAWSAVRATNPAAGHGVVVLGDRRVRAVSPAARSFGIVRGMSIALARRRCPELRVLPIVDAAPVVDALGALLDAEVGAPLRVAGGWACRIPRGTSLGSMQLATRIAERAWQALGLEVRVAIGSTEAGARTLARALPAGHVAVTTGSAGAAWDRAARRGAPTSYPDVEGLVTSARALARASRADVRAMRLETELGGMTVALPSGRASLADRVERCVRANFVRLRGPASVRLIGPAAPAAPVQLPLAIAAR